MKALKSKLASELLADSTGRVQLREFLVNKRASTLSGQPVICFEIRQGSMAGKVLQAAVVPKAANAD